MEKGRGSSVEIWDVVSVLNATVLGGCGRTNRVDTLLMSIEYK